MFVIEEGELSFDDGLNGGIFTILRERKLSIDHAIQDDS